MKCMKVSLLGKKGIFNHIHTPNNLPFVCVPQVSLCNPRQRPPHTAFTRCYDLLNSGTLKCSSPAQWPTEAKFLPEIIKVNRILMAPRRLVKTISRPRYNAVS